MKRIPRRALTLGLLLCSACSADDVTLSEPTLETPGSFVATAAPNADGFWLLRTILALKLENREVVLFMLRYPQTPATIDEARALAQGPPLASMQVELVLAKDLVTLGSEVVWFRTLTAEERDVVL